MEAKEEIKDWWKWINGCDHMKMLGTSQARGEMQLTSTREI